MASKLLTPARPLLQLRGNSTLQNSTLHLSEISNRHLKLHMNKLLIPPMHACTHACAPPQCSVTGTSSLPPKSLGVLLAFSPSVPILKQQTLRLLGKAVSGSLSTPAWLQRMGLGLECFLTKRLQSQSARPVQAYHLSCGISLPVLGTVSVPLFCLSTDVSRPRVCSQLPLFPTPRDRG